MKLNKRFFIFVAIISFFIVIFGIFLFFDHMANEDRDYLLNNEMLQLAHKLRIYKQQHGQYPKTITFVQNSDNLCVWNIYRKCTKVYYQTYNNSQEFHLAMKSFTWVILWYDDKFCFDQDRTNFLPKLNAQPRWYFCAADPPGNTYNVFPEYRKDKKVFYNPSDWPEIR